MEIAVEKAVECGVGAIVPLITTRSVVKGREDSARVARWRRIARSAAAQSGRFRVPHLAEPVPLRAALEAAASGTVLLAHPADDPATVRHALAGAAPGPPVAIFVGPEGGFTEEEIEEGRRFGGISVSLGETRLRTETAAVTAVVLAMASLSETS